MGDRARTLSDETPPPLDTLGTAAKGEYFRELGVILGAVLSTPIRHVRDAA